MEEASGWTLQEDRIYVMGIVNITPDSFYDGGRFAEPRRAVEHALHLVSEGADMLDLGGESSRPGSEPVSPQEELDRVLPVLESLRRETDTPISVDTTKADVARSALESGATIINDISALRFDPAMTETVAASNAWVILMHMQGTPQTMQQAPTYDDVVSDVRRFLAQRVEAAIQGGVNPERVIVDPGIGFGKSLEHNLELLRRLDRIASLGKPVLVGTSRKSFLGAITGEPATQRLSGTVVANTAAILHGAQLLRVHDVKEGRRTADVAARLRDYETSHS